MNPSIISLIGAIALTGCAAMESSQSGNWRGSGFPLSYPGDLSEYQPAGATRNNSTGELDLDQQDDRRTSHNLATQQRKLILDKLEKNIQRSVPEESFPITLGYIVMFNEAGTETYVLRSGEIVFPATLDDVCTGVQPLPQYVSIPDYVPHPPNKKCRCRWVEWGDGLHEGAHAHCSTVPECWPHNCR